MTFTIEGPLAVVITVLFFGGLAALVTWGYWLRATGVDPDSSVWARVAGRYATEQPLVVWFITVIPVVVVLSLVGQVEAWVPLLVAGVVCGVWVWWLARLAGRRRGSATPSSAPSEPAVVTCLTDDQAHEVARLTQAGYEAQGTRLDGSVELFRPASWTHSESTTRVSPGGHRYGTLGANTYWLAIFPLILATAWGWQTLFLSVPIALGYVWFRWQQHSEESTIRPAGETKEIEQADADLRESGYGRQPTRS